MDCPHQLPRPMIGSILVVFSGGNYSEISNTVVRRIAVDVVNIAGWQNTMMDSINNPMQVVTLVFNPDCPVSVWPH